MKIQLATAAVLAALLTCGCADFKAGVITKDNSRDVDLTKNGLVAMSGVIDESGTEILAHAKRTGDDRYYTFKINPARVLDDFAWIGPVLIRPRNIPEGALVVYSLPEGEYKLDMLSVETFWGGKRNTEFVWVEKRPFMVKKNEVTYLGSYDIHVKRALVVQDITFKAEDKSEKLREQNKDMEIIKDKQWNVSIVPIVKSK